MWRLKRPNLQDHLECPRTGPLPAFEETSVRLAVRLEFLPDRGRTQRARFIDAYLPCHV